MKKILSSAVVAGLLLTVGATQALAIGGASGPRTDYVLQGKLGAVKANPYGIAPLTAIISNGGYDIKDVTVRIVPKPGGQEIKYKVANKHLLTHGGIPVFGMYADYQNTVEVEYTRIYKGQEEVIKEDYKIYAPAVWSNGSGLRGQKSAFFDSIEITKEPTEKFADRLYFINNLGGKSANGVELVWNNPMGGALEWNFEPNNYILDTKGEVRWYMFYPPIYNLHSAFNAGVMMGFKQNDDGAITWGYGQNYAKYDILGREIFNRPLPKGYIDFSHSMDNMDNGNYLLRVASANTKRPDGKNVRTVRDVIIEVDKDGNVVDDWKLFQILDPYRDNVLKVLDQGAVCLNIDASQAGQTLSDDDLAALDASDKFGDIVGSGAGRNWAHVNSVDHDPSDDSIVISSRHQNAVIKIGRDKKVKWILGAHKGWKDEFKQYLLQPVDSEGNKIVCEDEYTKCPGYLNPEGGFDWTYTQHTAFVIDSKTNEDVVTVAVFDNGDSRGFEQPALPDMKYSRGVIYKVDQKNMTVEQIWEYGKQRGKSYYSPVTSLTEYHEDKDSVLVYSATAGMDFDLATGTRIGAPTPTLSEFEWNATEPSFELKIHMSGSSGYQAFPFSVEKALSK
ncbi:MAG: aryl-sulfate sulfotransferase [Campylobacteraceae bacterium]|nr:aryl-sulfate sulfotransferase [Campylobacteraceae bacterium]